MQRQSDFVDSALLFGKFCQDAIDLNAVGCDGVEITLRYVVRYFHLNIKYCSPIRAPRGTQYAYTCNQ